MASEVMQVLNSRLLGKGVVQHRQQGRRSVRRPLVIACWREKAFHPSTVGPALTLVARRHAALPRRYPSPRMSALPDDQQQSTSETGQGPDLADIWAQVQASQEMGTASLLSSFTPPADSAAWLASLSSQDPLSIPTGDSTEVSEQEKRQKNPRGVSSPGGALPSELMSVLSTKAEGEYYYPEDRFFEEVDVSEVQDQLWKHLEDDAIPTEFKADMNGDGFSKADESVKGPPEADEIVNGLSAADESVYGLSEADEKALDELTLLLTGGDRELMERVKAEEIAAREKSDPFEDGDDCGFQTPGMAEVEGKLRDALRQVVNVLEENAKLKDQLGSKKPATSEQKKSQHREPAKEPSTEVPRPSSTQETSTSQGELSLEDSFAAMYDTAYQQARSNRKRSQKRNSQGSRTDDKSQQDDATWHPHPIKRAMLEADPDAIFPDFKPGDYDQLDPLREKALRGLLSWGPVGKPEPEPEEDLIVDLGDGEEVLKAGLPKNDKEFKERFGGLPAYPLASDWFEEEDGQEITTYIPAPDSDPQERMMRAKIEHLAYRLGDHLAGKPGANAFAEGLFAATCRTEGFSVCHLAPEGYREWLEALKRAGCPLVLDLIWYEAKAAESTKRWVHTTWTVHPPADLASSMQALGALDWWLAECGEAETGSTSKVEQSYQGESASDDEIDEDGWSFIRVGKGKKQAGPPFIAGETRFEMDESGKVVGINTEWDNESPHRDLQDQHSLWLAAVLRAALVHVG